MKKIYSILVFFICASVMLSCKKKEDPEPDVQIPVPLYYFTATLQGQSYDYQIFNGTEPYESWVGQSGISDVIYDGGIVNNTTNESFSISKGTLLTSGWYPTDQEFFNFFNKGTATFSDDAANGIQIQFWDANGNEWNSNGVQTTSSFKFTKVEKKTIYGQAVVDYEATFNCKLYDAATGLNVKNLKGTCKLSFENW